MTEQILRNAFNTQTVREAIGYSNDAMVMVRSDPYDDEYDNGEMMIQVKFDLKGCSSSYFSLRIKELSGCCGVLEIIRPRSTYLSAARFAIAMDVIVEQLRIQVHQPYNEWGNQLLATTSTESCPQWVAYVKSRKWDHFSSAINPRSGRRVTIWRKVV